jgi:hypothetical protein
LDYRLSHRDVTVQGVSFRALAAAASAVVCAAALLSPPATAAPDNQPPPSLTQQSLAVPAGWQVGGSPSAPVLTWTPTEPVRLGDARVEFWLRNRLLGVPTPSPDGDLFTLRLTEPLTGDLSTLAVIAAGRRLDAQAPPTSPGPDALAPAQTVDQLIAAQMNLTPVTDDPGEPGPFATERDTYDLATYKVPGMPTPLEVLGEVVRPVGAPGARPLVLLLHGWHDYCYDGPPAADEWPCSPESKPVPNHLGYLDTQQLLASQGFVTVSIRANAINAQDNSTEDRGATARSALVRHHLSLWQQWAGGAPSPLDTSIAGQVDLDNVVLVGHSRGGEGVNRAAIDTDADDPWRISGQLLIGPTSFGGQIAPGTPTVVLLPYCDGDVYDLQGQRYVDLARDLTVDPAAGRVLRSSVLVAGANHNFFNSEWTPGVSAAPSFDDWFDSNDRMCGTSSPVRLTDAEQRQLGATYTAAAVQAFTQRDQQAATLLDGSPVRAASVGDAVVRSTALGARRDLVLRPTPGQPTPESEATTSRICRGFGGTRAARCAADPLSPHWLPVLAPEFEPPPYAWHVAWTAATGTGGIELPAPADLSGRPAVELRATSAPGESARVRVRLVDGTGASDDSAVRTVAGYPDGASSNRIVASTLRLRTSAFDDVDLADIRRIELVPVSSTGRVWVLDASARRPGLPSLRPVAVPRLDATDVIETEGEGGSRTVAIRVTLTGTLTRPAQVLTVLTSPRDEPPVATTVTLQPGDTGFDVPVTFEADRRDDFPRLRYVLRMKALSEVTTGRYDGSLLVRDDDPSPRVTVDDPSVSAREGEPLQWTFRLPRRSDREVFGAFDARSVDGEELRVADLPSGWRGDCLDPSASLSTRLSRVQVYCLNAAFQPGERVMTMSLPTVRDGRAEVAERVRLVLVQQDPRGSFVSDLTLTGVVRDR